MTNDENNNRKLIYKIIFNIVLFIVLPIIVAPLELLARIHEVFVPWAKMGIASIFLWLSLDTGLSIGELIRNRE